MPFGAVASGEIEGLNVSDRIAVAIGGPIINLLVSVVFIAFWWIYPDSYAFTDIIVEANLSLFIVNLIPIMPLDGGRVINAFLTDRISKEKADKITKILSIVLSMGLFALFILSAFYTFNLSLLFFSLFTLFGAFGGGKNNKYVRLYFGVERLLKNGAKIKRYAISSDTSIKQIIRLCDSASVNEFDVYKNGKKIAFISYEKLSEILVKANFYEKVEKYL